MATGFIWHETYMWHDPGNFAGPFAPGGYVQPGEHIENAESKRRLKNLLDASGLSARLVAVAPRAASDAELLRVHSPAYLERVRQASRAGGGEVGVNACVGGGGFEIVVLSAGGVIAAVEAVLGGLVDNAYALVRPPGHHATRDAGMGFCIFANAAIAGRHALEALGLSRVALVDWDVHHGNGTQAAFYSDPRALTISLHQDGVFPRASGGVNEPGEGAGTGYNINIPLPAGCGFGAYRLAFERVVLPALHDFRPELIIVPCGYDAGFQDPLARMLLGPSAFREMTQMVKAAARELCAGRLVLCHEGGYSAHTVPFFGHAVIEELAGQRMAVTDALEAGMRSMPGQELLPHQEAAVERARAAAYAHPWRKRRASHAA